MIERTEAEIRELDDGALEKAWLYWRRENEPARRGPEGEADRKLAQRQFLMVSAEVGRRRLGFET